jgi:hypothetical protein
MDFVVGQFVRLSSAGGFGEDAAGQDIGDEMRALDLRADRVVEVTAYDEERDLWLLSWTDDNDTPRITSVTAAQAALFEEF